MASHRFNLLFRLKKPKNYIKGKMHVYMRITINSERLELSFNREFDPARWDAKLTRAIGTKEDARTLNAYLESMLVKVHEAHREIVAANEILTLGKLKNKLLGREVEHPHLLLEIFAQHNNQMKELIEKEEYAQGT